MKKILRLVTTSVLTLTLVACGEASSSTSSVSSSASSSVASSSVASSFAAVTSITLAPAATNDLTQVMGSLKTVVINASFNAGVNPEQQVTWLVNDVVSKQTGRSFEFTPSAVGTYVIKARVGTVNSNSQTVGVTGSALSPTLAFEVPVFKDAKTLEIKGTAGASVTVTGATLEDSSYFDIAKETYVLNFKTAIEFGAEVKVKFSKDGQDSELTALFDTRKIEINAADATFKAAVTAKTYVKVSDSIYSVDRPFVLRADGEVARVLSDTFTVNIPLKSTDLNGTAVDYKLERLSAPTGAAAYDMQQGQLAVSSGNAGGLTLQQVLNRETPLGDYVYKLTLGTKAQEFTVRVTDPKATLEAADQTVGAAKFKVTLSTAEKLASGVAAGDLKAAVGLTATAADKFEITKDYLISGYAYQQFAFTFTAKNISVPSNLLGTETSAIASRPNQLRATVAGPGGLTFLRVGADTPQNTLPNAVTFRNNYPQVVGTDPAFTITNRVDASTPVGDYVYTINILQLGEVIHTETLTVTVKNPAPKLDFTATSTDATVLQWTSVLQGKNLNSAIFNPDFVGIYQKTGTSPAEQTTHTQYTLVRAETSAPNLFLGRLYLDTSATGNKALVTTGLADKVILASASDGTVATTDYWRYVTIAEDTSGTHPAVSNWVPTFNTTLADYLGAVPAASDSPASAPEAGVQHFLKLGAGAGDANILRFSADGVTTWADVVITSWTAAANDGTIYMSDANNIYMYIHASTKKWNKVTLPTVALAITYTATVVTADPTANFPAAGTYLLNTTANTLKMSTGTALTAALIPADNTLVFANNKIYKKTGTGTPVYTATEDYSFIHYKDSLISYNSSTSAFEAKVGEKYLVNIVSGQIIESTTAANNYFRNYQVNSVDQKWSGAVINTSTFGTVESTAPTSGLVAGQFYVDSNSITLNSQAATNRLYKRSATAWVEQSALTPVDTIFVNSADSKVYIYKQVGTSTERQMVLLADTDKQFRSNVLLKKADNAFVRYTLATSGGVGTAAVGTFASPVTRQAAMAIFDTAVVQNALLVAAPNAVDLIHSSGSTLQATKLAPLASPLTITANTVTVNKPMGASFSPYTVRVKLEATNLTSAVNQLAPQESSFASANKLPDGLAGSRELLTFNKTYTGPMTNATLDTANKADVKVGIVAGTANAKSTVTNRVSVAPKTFDLYTGKGAVVDFGNVFELEVTSATVNGTYVFTVVLGTETKTISVVVGSAVPTIDVFVENLTEGAQNINKLIAPASGTYKVNLSSPAADAKATVGLDFIGRFLKPASGTTLTYTLTREFDFKTNNSAAATADKWTNVRTDVVAFQDLLGADGAIKASGLNQIMQGATSTSTGNTLILNSVGKYTFKLQIGTAVRDFVIEVLPFPGVTISNAFIGTRTSDVDTISRTTALTRWESNILVPMQPALAAGVGSRNIYLDVAAQNLPSTVYYKSQLRTVSGALTIAQTTAGNPATPTQGVYTATVSTNLAVGETITLGDKTLVAVAANAVVGKSFVPGGSAANSVTAIVSALQGNMPTGLTVTGSTDVLTLTQTAGNESATPPVRVLGLDASPLPYLLDTELEDAALTFTSGVATIMIPGASNLTAAKSEIYFVYIYSGNGLPIGYIKVTYRVIDTSQELWVADLEPRS